MRNSTRWLWLSLFAAALAIAPAPPSQAKAKPHKLIILGLDLSKSNPLVTDKLYAEKVAQRVGPMIKPLEPHDEVRVRTFGNYDAREQRLQFDYVISSRNNPDFVASQLEGVIAGVPTLIERGTIKAQDWTYIVAFLENMAGVVDCTKTDVTVVLASDGIEDSDNAHLTTEQGHLPLPAKKIFAGCSSLQILGLGVGAKNPGLTSHLRNEWQAWAAAAGFKAFQGLNDW